MEEAVRMEVDVDTEVSDEPKEKKERTSMLINLSGSEEVPFPEALKTIAEVDDTFGIFQNGRATLLQPLLTSPCPAIETGTAENSQCVSLTFSPFTGDESFMPIAAADDSLGISKNGQAGVAPSDPLPATDLQASPPLAQSESPDGNCNPCVDSDPCVPIMEINDMFRMLKIGQDPPNEPLQTSSPIPRTKEVERVEPDKETPELELPTTLNDTFGIYKNAHEHAHAQGGTENLETWNLDTCAVDGLYTTAVDLNETDTFGIFKNDPIHLPEQSLASTAIHTADVAKDSEIRDDDIFGIFIQGGAPPDEVLPTCTAPASLHLPTENSESADGNCSPCGVNSEPSILIMDTNDIFGMLKIGQDPPNEPLQTTSPIPRTKLVERVEPTKGNTGHCVGTEPMPNIEVVNDVEEVEILANDQVPQAEKQLPSPPPFTNCLAENFESVDCNSNTFTANESITKIDDASVAAKDEVFPSRPHTPLLTSPCPAIATGTAENSQCVGLTCSPFTGDESFIPIAAMNDSFGISKNGQAGVAPSNPLPTTDLQASPPPAGPAQSQTTETSEPTWNWNPFADDTSYIPVVMRPPVATLESIRKMVEEIFTFTYSPYSSPKRPRMDVVDPDTSRHSSTRIHSVRQEKIEVPEVVSDRDMRMMTPTRDICDFQTPPRTRTPSTVVRQANFTFKKDESQTSSYTSKKSTSSPCFKTPVKTKVQEPHDSSVKKASSCTRLSFTSTSSTSSVESDSKKRLLPVLPGRGTLKFDKKPGSVLSNPFNTKLKFDTKPSAMTARVQPLKATLSSEFAVKARAEAEVKNEVKPSQPKVCASAPVHRKFLSPIAASSPKHNPSNQKLNSSFSGQNESYTIPTTPTRKRMSAVKSSGYGRPQASQQPSSATSSTSSLNSTRTMESPSKRVSAPNLSRPILKSPMFDRKSESQLSSAPSFNVEEKAKPAPLAAVTSGGLRNKENIPRLINRFGFKK